MLPHLKIHTHTQLSFNSHYGQFSCSSQQLQSSLTSLLSFPCIPLVTESVDSEILDYKNPQNFTSGRLSLKNYNFASVTNLFQHLTYSWNHFTSKKKESSISWEPRHKVAINSSLFGTNCLVFFWLQLALQILTLP